MNVHAKQNNFEVHLYRDIVSNNFTVLLYFTTLHPLFLKTSFSRTMGVKLGRCGLTAGLGWGFDHSLAFSHFQTLVTINLCTFQSSSVRKPDRPRGKLAAISSSFKDSPTNNRRGSLRGMVLGSQ